MNDGHSRRPAGSGRRRPDPALIRLSAEDDEDGEEIEILEIEGLPSDAPAPAAGDGADEPAPTRGDQETGDGGTATAVPDEGEAAGGPDAGGEEPLQAELRVAEDRLLRLRAEFDNYRKRVERERGEMSADLNADLVGQLLPVLDNLKRALAAEGDTTGEAYRDGVELIARQFMEILTRSGLTPIETEGQPFDPRVHEAVAVEQNGHVAANTITEELEPGYLFRNRLLKPARVRVAVPPES